ncbi:Ethanolaminephosphotransferase 1 [Hondaea fermentalgiana]|uniref:Ethanolaminephosphotransferase 1 n=1 Tax=Hondaea fermentalgiana TaxID=2315210 RepID=A0A2R5GAD8_9STRA|nr:Ethanolaminephosphotransferase 1 [Hondaea fermentalgiana]|eukprot:GBG27555.1 Ethanolaminephosphotransferase 1 [Hondaea fermentalgiana]
MLSAVRSEEEWKDFETAVHAYKYSSPTLSLFERLYLEAFWNKVVFLYPTWLAPNVITLSGYACVWIAYIITISGSPNLDGNLENWKYVVCGVLYFMYQTLDGSDGKQARRTGSGSALGELMDHGADAVVTALLCIVTSDVFAFGINSVWIWVFILVAQTNFFMSNMTLVHSGRQKFFDLDVMEVQTAMILTLIAAGIFGPEALTSITVPVPDFARAIYIDCAGMVPKSQAIDLSDGRLSMRNIVLLGGLFGCLFNYPQYVFASLRPYILLKQEDRPQHVKDGVTGSGIKALMFHLLLIHSYVILAASCVYSALQISDSARSASAMRALVFVASFGFADLMDRVLLMRVARRPLPYLPPGFWPLILFFIGARFFEPVELIEGPWWWALALLSFVFHHAYFLSAVKNLAKALGIHPLKIRPKKKD